MPTAASPSSSAVARHSEWGGSVLQRMVQGDDLEFI
jgi:hypothetical protein